MDYSGMDTILHPCQQPDPVEDVKGGLEGMQPPQLAVAGYLTRVVPLRWISSPTAFLTLLLGGSKRTGGGEKSPASTRVDQRASSFHRGDWIGSYNIWPSFLGHPERKETCLGSSTALNGAQCRQGRPDASSAVL